MNVHDRRGPSAGRVAAGGGGLAALVLVGAAIFFPDLEPVLRAFGVGDVNAPPAASRSAPVDDETGRFVAVTLGYTEDVWGEIFAAGAFPRAGSNYDEPTLVLYSGRDQSACGVADANLGPFYCPADGSIYIDPSFYEIMATRLNAPGDFAQAYVIAHEVAHHVQNLNGVLVDVHRRRLRLSEVEGNRLTVRLELQADCFAGVWAHRAEKKHRILERGDLEEALRAAYQVGDDVLQRMSGAPVDESKFTHGSAEQRARWFLIGLKSGEVASCDSFSPAYQDL